MLVTSRLTHYQTTNFRLFQTERVCRRQFQIWRRWQKVNQTGRKHCWKKEKLLVTSNFSFYHSVFERLVSQRSQKVSLCGNGLKWGMCSKELRQTLGLFYIEGICRGQLCKSDQNEVCHWYCRKHCGKRIKCWLPAYFLFPQCFQNLSSSGRCGQGLDLMYF